MWTPDSLRAFEEEVREIYRQGQIRAPVHLSRGNEEQLIEVFSQVTMRDWVFSTYRSHYHALLKGIPRERVLAEIRAGHSIHLTFPEYHFRFYSSAIVGGCLPIALGTALGLKGNDRGENARVWCFVGDMAAKTGTFHECLKYASNQELPINFVVECNALSTNTPTDEVWGWRHVHQAGLKPLVVLAWDGGRAMHYCYHREWPHYGIGEWVNFDQNGQEPGNERSDVMA